MPRPEWAPVLVPHGPQVEDRGSGRVPGTLRDGNDPGCHGDGQWERKRLTRDYIAKEGEILCRFW